jgi:hypothetical protein
MPCPCWSGINFRLSQNYAESSKTFLSLIKMKRWVSEKRQLPFSHMIGLTLNLGSVKMPIRI